MRFEMQATESMETGEMGWLDSRIGGTDIFGPLGYHYGLAHDCLEHFAFGSVADEIEAHGAMYWVRYEGGWSMPNFGKSLNMTDFAAEWQNLLNGLMQDPFLPTAPKTRSLDSCIESDISEIIELGIAYVNRECISSDTEEDGDSRKELARIASVFRAFFRRGYRKAAKRYKGIPACSVANLYNVLAAAFERNRPEFEGQAIIVEVNPKTGRVSIDENYPEND